MDGINVIITMDMTILCGQSRIIMVCYDTTKCDKCVLHVWCFRCITHVIHTPVMQEYNTYM